VNTTAFILAITGIVAAFAVMAATIVYAMRPAREKHDGLVRCRCQHEPIGRTTSDDRGRW
jgi:hypothetical protein